jgi:hypothetical protein
MEKVHFHLCYEVSDLHSLSAMQLEFIIAQVRASKGTKELAKDFNQWQSLREREDGMTMTLEWMNDEWMKQVTSRLHQNGEVCCHCRSPYKILREKMSADGESCWRQFLTVLEYIGTVAIGTCSSEYRTINAI